MDLNISFYMISYMVDCKLPENANSAICQNHVKKCNNHHPPSKIRPIIPYFGGKTRVANELVCKFPEHHTFVEPFIGGGSVYWKNDIAKNFVINDLNKDIYHLYKDAKNNPNSIKKCDLNNMGKEKFNKIREKNSKTACEVIKLHKHSFSGAPKNGWARKDQNFKNPFNDGHTDKLRKTKILNQDFEKVLKENDNKGTLHYLDPPYVEAGKAYNTQGVTAKQVCDAVKRLKKSKAVISYDNHKDVKSSCKGLKMGTLQVPYSSSMGANKVKKEILITNY